MKQNLTPHLMVLILLVFCLGCPQTSLALPDGGSSQSTPVGPSPQRAAIRISAFSGIPDIIGASIGVSRFRPLEIEFGGSTAFFANSAFLRLGVAPELLNRRRGDGSGWTLHLPLFAGYRYLQTRPPETDARLHGVAANGGLEAVYWLRPGLGLDLQLLVGAAYWVKQTKETEMPLIPDTRLAIGIAF